MNRGYSGMNTDPRSILRSLLSGNTIAVLGGAHDALSARIVEEVQFDGVWSSGFSISLGSRCMPDADLLTMTENLDIVRNIVDAVRIPVVADCDAGYGNAINVMRMVREYEKAGVAGVCIEDNCFPKRCSLYDQWDRPLLSVAEMAGKIRAAKAAQRDPEFVVVARIEALIAGQGVDVALNRASAYSEAGADALLVHAKEFAALKQFTSDWRGTCPLVVVPTLFSDISLAELESCGFRVAIFPNQAVRAAVRAMRDTLETIRRTGTARSIDGEIVPLSEVYRLVGLDELRAAEDEFLVQDVHVQRA
jgi:phosphoenolpyruvate phosphomutase